LNNILDHISKKLVEYQQDALTKDTPVNRWVVAYSGGVDSTVLLHTVVEANKLSPHPLPIVALHVNHQLSDDSDAWHYHCQSVATSLSVCFAAQTVDVVEKGKGIEMAARNARYRVFEDYLLEGDRLLQGHHQSDQAETVLLRLLRGAGVRGLSAIPEYRSLNKASLCRPLLMIPQVVITSYAIEQQLQWVEDESNNNSKYDRNFLRNEVIPLIKKRWSMLDSQLYKLTERMKQTEDLLCELAEQDMQQLDMKTARTGFSLSFKALSMLSYNRRNNLLRYWCDLCECSLPESDHLEQIDHQFFSRSALLSSACVTWSSVEFRYFSGRVYLMKKLPVFKNEDNAYPWDTMANLSLGSAGYLAIDPASTEEGKTLDLAAGDYQIRWRKGGERCTPVDRQHSQTVKKLLQEYNLEVWLRDRVPLIYKGDDLVAVGDLWINQGYEVASGSKAIRLSWLCE